jgi:High-affinity Fe2+/Pb2+ permease
VLATFVIGLREGLEAALIVGIIAAFLKRNGASMRPMWTGVSTAIVLAIGVGVGLHAIEASLPQAGQEAMETVIGAVAVFFVTGMIVWVRKHSRGMKRELEREAQAALGNGTAWALGGMAFLAVLKEGFETSVFLLATFQASTSAGAATICAVLGILVSVGIGIGIYRGGVKLNLGKFFTATGVFLVFVAAGLVVSTLRTAHEASWLAIGQQTTVDLSWLAPRGSVQSALLTGVLGIPSDPRVIELLGWLLYLVPVLGYTLWPAGWRPAPDRVPRVQLGIACGLAVAALSLAVAVPAAPDAVAPHTAPLASGGSIAFEPDGRGATLAVTGRATARYRYGPADAIPSARSGADTRWRTEVSEQPSGRPDSVTLDELVQLAGGRLPVGFDPVRDPGPFSASWSQSGAVTVWTRHDGVVDARSEARTVLTVSGGGLGARRSITVPDPGAWSVDGAYTTATADAIGTASTRRAEVDLWRVLLPLSFVVSAAVLALAAVRGIRRARRSGRADRPTAEARPTAKPSPVPESASVPDQRSTSYAAD